MRDDGDPTRAFEAGRAGVFTRLVTSAQLDPRDAELWIARWEREAEATGRERGSTGYWDEAWAWIEGERNPPKTDMNAEGGDGQVYGG